MPVKIVKRAAQVPATTAEARTEDPDTSQAAADMVERDMPGLQKTVYDAVCQCSDGATVDELAILLGIQTETVSPRMRPLERKGFIADSGKRRHLPDKKVGRIVWVKKQ